jgi:4-hydroxythreonine-4-phosphate dehydrogenase
MGDPAGVGPELCLEVLGNDPLRQECIPIVFGDLSVLERAATQRLHPEGLPDFDVITPSDWPEACRRVTGPAVLDLRAISADALTPGIVGPLTGQASYAYIDASIDAAVAGQVDAVTTGPIHKEAIQAAGVPYPGHTEIYAAKTSAERACMMLTSRELTCSFVTTHVGYRDVPGLLSQQRIYDVIRLSHDAIRQLKGHTPKLVVCGLNPHAGENGLFGDKEEERLIIPAIERALAEGIDVKGPLPPDTAFLPRRRAANDCFVCMYHDQGHIPLKALAFDLAVNITLGLPIIRTSVDHGTALDIAWQGQAEVSSMLEAIRLAIRLARAKLLA